MITASGLTTHHKQRLAACHHVVPGLPSQRRFYALTARYKGFSGGVGSGKTTGLCHEALRAAGRNPGCLGLIGGPTYPHLHDVTIPTMLGILEELHIPYRVWEGARPRLYLERQEVLILFRTLENPDRLRGLNLAWFGVDELTYCRAAAWQVLCQRLRHPQAKQLEGFAVWTPKGFDWVYQLFISPQRKLPHYQAVLAGPRENIAVLEAHPQYYEELKQQYDELFYRQEALGEYLNIFSGGCYPSFKEDRNAKILVEYEPNLGGMAWALDFNVDPMASLICQRKGPRRLDILKEITLRPGDTERMCEAFVVAAQPYLSAWRLTHGGQRLPVTLYGDAAGHARSLVGKAIYAIIQQYFQSLARDFELKMNANVSNPKVVDRVASVNAMLYNAAGQVGLLVHPQCTELITDFFQVAWMKNDQTEIDKKTDRQRTHWSDALGYLIYRDFRVDPFQRQISLPDGSSYIAG